MKKIVDFCLFYFLVYSLSFLMHRKQPLRVGAVMKGNVSGVSVVVKGTTYGTVWL
jgi:hypothetical protein